MLYNLWTVLSVSCVASRLTTDQLQCHEYLWFLLLRNASVWNFCLTTELTHQLLTLGHVQHNYSIFVVSSIMHVLNQNLF